jgi:hypothetical protein
MVVAIAVSACGPLGAPAPQAPLSESDQQVAAEQLARAFTGICLSATDARTATQALQAQGWSPFGAVWADPGSLFYAAKPSRAFPSGLWVFADRHRAGQAVPDILCVGHYPALGDGPMVAAMEHHWGASQGGSAIYPGSQSWTFRMRNAVLTPGGDGGGGPATAAALASLGPGEALVYAQVFYNANQHDVASLVSVRRRGA